MFLNLIAEFNLFFFLNPLLAEQQRNVIRDLHNESGLFLSTKHETTKKHALISPLHLYVVKSKEDDFVYLIDCFCK